MLRPLAVQTPDFKKRESLDLTSNTLVTRKSPDYDQMNDMDVFLEIR